MLRIEGTLGFLYVLCWRIGEEALKTAAILIHDFCWKSYGTRDG